jgi:hypothetical protein
MTLPKDKDIDRSKYVENLFIQLRMLNDKLVAINSVLKPTDELKETVEKNWTLLSGLLYLHYESAIIQICWLYGDDVNSRVSVVEHLNFLANETGLLEFFADKHIRTEFPSISDDERNSRTKSRKNEFVTTLGEFKTRIDSLENNERKRIKLARHNLFAHQSLLAFNSLFDSPAKAKEVWENFAPTFEDVQVAGNLIIELGNFFKYLEQETSFIFHESSLLTEVVKKLSKI